MTLTLRAVSLNDHPLTTPITVHFDAHGGSIGRADHNTMALPDPKRHISRQQAEVRAVDGRFSITNVGSANPIIVGSRTLARGESAALGAGDRLRIGGYLLEVDAGASAAAETIVRGRAAVDLATPPARRAADPADAHRPAFGTAGDAPLSPGNPFASLLGGDAPAAVDAAWPASRGEAAGAWQPALRPHAEDHGAASSPARLPDDFDPFAPPPPAPPAAAAPHADIGGGVFADLVPAPGQRSIDSLFGLSPGGGRDPLARFLDASAPAPSARGARSDPPASAAPAAPAPRSADPLALFGGPVAPSPGSRPTGSDHVPELQAAFAPPRLVRAEPLPGTRPAADAAAAPAASAAAAVHGSGGSSSAAATRDTGAPSSAAWAAFCEGAGVRVERQGTSDAEALREAGALLRAAIDGALRLMAVRASAKHELHAAVTVIQPQRNNPLKFSPDAGTALEQLLQPPMRGFLPGAAAVEDAMDDLVGHAIGMLAGTRAALEGVLDRFAPAQLVGKLAARSVLDSVLPSHRKARLWELYLQHFETIRSEAQDDFHSLFGRAFLAAYERQLEQLRGR